MKEAYNSIVSGIYILETNGSACIVDAVAQLSIGKNPLVAVSVNKLSYTHEKLKENNKFSISILAKDINGEIIKTFGFNSSRKLNKFEKVPYKIVDEMRIIDDSIGYMILEKVSEIDCDTHTLFIGRIVLDQRNNDKEELVYQYYQKHKEEYIEYKVSDDRTVWICTVCGFVYEGDPLPDDYICPVCGATKEKFIRVNQNQRG